jgi:CheY-like chemotaxis protein/two-component sensor histidine kinase
VVASDLALLARPSADEMAIVDLGPIIDGALQMAQNQLRHRARITRRYAADAVVCGHASRLGQVFLNLLVNAAQAVPDGRADENEIAITVRTDGGRVLVSVRDTGYGIPESIVERIFDPFFTTKPVGGGTGLGLAICKSIIQSHGGHLRVESAVGVGTTFHVDLPAAVGSAQTSAESAAPRPQAARRRRVVVIDDEAHICSALRRMLKSEHDVVTYTDAREALETLLGDGHVDAILCDLMMPHLTGMDVHAALCARRPDVARRMVFLSGGAFSQTARAFLQRPDVLSLDKPFTLERLRRALRRLEV